MSDVVRFSSNGVEEVKTGLGWRKVQSAAAENAPSDIPVIDLSDINYPDISRRRQVARRICDVCVDIGFFYVSNHGIPASVVDGIFHESKRFFHELTLEEKMQMDTKRHEHYYGYYPIDFDPNQPAGAKLNESINFGYESRADPAAIDEQDCGTNWWPAESRLPGFKTAILQYMGYVLTLSRSLLRMFALGLGLDEKSFDHLATKPYSILKMGHYPGNLGEAKQPSSIRPHTDYELLTILLQDSIQSLEVVSRTGKWTPVKPIAGTFVVNIGDSLSMLTNGRFVSTMHRVLNKSGCNRYSVPFFLGANEEVELRAIESFITPERPMMFQPITSGEYIRRSLQGVYSKPNIEVEYGTLDIKD